MNKLIYGIDKNITPNKDAKHLASYGYEGDVDNFLLRSQLIKKVRKQLKKQKLKVVDFKKIEKIVNNLYYDAKHHRIFTQKKCFFIKFYHPDRVGEVVKRAIYANITTKI